MGITTQNFRDQCNCFLNALGRRHVVPLLHSHLEAHNDQIFFHYTAPQEKIQYMVSYQCYGLLQGQVGWSSGMCLCQGGWYQVKVPSNPNHSMSSFHHLLLTTKHYSTRQHKKVSQKNQREQIQVLLPPVAQCWMTELRANLSIYHQRHSSVSVCHC